MPETYDPYAELTAALDKLGYDYTEGADMVGEYVSVPQADCQVWHPDYNTGRLPIWVLTRHNDETNGAYDVFVEADTRAEPTAVLTGYAEITVYDATFDINGGSGRPIGRPADQPFEPALPLVLLLLGRLAGRPDTTAADIAAQIGLAPEPQQPAATPETIKAADEGWWTCTCGNEPDGFGFYPCTPDGAALTRSDGTETEGYASWDGKLMVCSGCGRIIDQSTYDQPAGTVTVVGRRATGSAAMLDRTWPSAAAYALAVIAGADNPPEHATSRLILLTLAAHADAALHLVPDRNGYSGTPWAKLAEWTLVAETDLRVFVAEHLAPYGWVLVREAHGDLPERVFIPDSVLR